MSTRAKILLFAKSDVFCDQAEVLARAALGEDLVVHRGRLGDPYPVERGAAEPVRGMLSFVSPWIIPAWHLDHAAQGFALNFHPGSTDYPGIGCYNFALYEEASEFGAVCHHMAPKVDTGAIVLERRFPLLASDTVSTLKLRTMVTMLSMFQEIVSGIARGEALPASGAKWQRQPFKRVELEALCEVTPDMSAAEVHRRVRAVKFPGAGGARITLHGVRFEVKSDS